MRMYSQKRKAEDYIPQSTTVPKATITLHRRTDHGSILPSFAPIRSIQKEHNLPGFSVQYEYQYHTIEHKRWYLCHMRIQTDPVTLVNTPFEIPTQGIHGYRKWIPWFLNSSEQLHRDTYSLSTVKCHIPGEDEAFIFHFCGIPKSNIHRLLEH